MPLKECQKDGKKGWRWGDGGVCYTGPDAKEKAKKQGAAIEISKKKHNKQGSMMEVNKLIKEYIDRKVAQAVAQAKESSEAYAELLDRADEVKALVELDEDINGGFGTGEMTIRQRRRALQNRLRELKLMERVYAHAITSHSEAKRRKFIAQAKEIIDEGGDVEAKIDAIIQTVGASK